jgi:hypothetical protein
MFKLVFRGQREMADSLEKIAKKMIARKRSALKKWATPIMAKSRLECPVDTRALQNSGKFEVSKDGDSVDFSYGNEEVDYAVIVHETHPTMSKFLERPLMEATPSAAKELGEGLDLEKAVEVTGGDE